MLIKKIFSREWIITTILVVFGVGLCIRLGIWQLDRLEQRRAFNSHVEAMWNAPPVKIPDDVSSIQLKDMEYRSVIAQGVYDFSSQVALRNQYSQDRYGYHLLTPLVVGEGTAVIVDRGWIPSEGNDNPSNWTVYNKNADTEISGIIRLGQSKPDVGGRPDPTLAPDQDGLKFWNNVNLVRLQNQMPYDLLDIYIQLDPVPENTTLPIPFQPEIELTEGPHLGYAGQWFTFALILAAGYPYYIFRKENQT